MEVFIGSQDSAKEPSTLAHRIVDRRKTTETSHSPCKMDDLPDQ